MARAKRTDRAEARRRYRAEIAEAQAAEAQAAEAIESEELDEAGDAPSQGRLASRPAGQPAAGRGSGSSRASIWDDGGRGDQPSRPGFTSVIRAAARPWNLASDLAYIPDLVLHTRAVWIPALATVASGIYFAATYAPAAENANGIAVFLLQLFVVPPTIAGPFLGGVLAPRATYIAGGIASLIGVLVFAAIVATVPVEGLAQGTTAGGTAALPLDRTAVIIQSLVVSVPFGVLIGGAGGYYRRFLNLSGAGARRREEQRARQSRTAASRTPARRR